MTDSLGAARRIKDEVVRLLKGKRTTSHEVLGHLMRENTFVDAVDFFDNISRTVASGSTAEVKAAIQMSKDYEEALIGLAGMVHEMRRGIEKAGSQDEREAVVLDSFSRIIVAYTEAKENS